MLKAAKAYLRMQVSTDSQGDLLLMLYDTAIKHLRGAIEKMRVGDVAAKGVLISKALAIIGELLESLNKERGGEIAQNLAQLYLYCNTRLLMANLKLKPELVEEVIAILSGLRQAFAAIMPSQSGVASLAQAGIGGEGGPAVPAADSGEASAEGADGGAQPVAEEPISFLPPVAPLAPPSPAAKPQEPAEAPPAARAAASRDSPAAVPEPAPDPKFIVPEEPAEPAEPRLRLRLRAASAYATNRR